MPSAEQEQNDRPPLRIDITGYGGIEEENKLEEVTVYAPPPPLFNVNNFLAQVSGSGLSKTNKFRVDILLPEMLQQSFGNISSLKFFCETADFPGRALNMSDIKIYGPSFKQPNQSIFTEITATFLCDSFMTQKSIFDFWMELINPSSSFDFEYKDNYAKDVVITQYDDAENPRYAMTLKEAFPSAIGPMTGSWADDNIQRLQVTFSYRYYEVEYLGDNNDNTENTTSIVQDFFNIFK